MLVFGFLGVFIEHNRMFAVETCDPFDELIHPNHRSSERRVCMVFTSFELKTTAVEIPVLSHEFLSEVADTRILFPSRRSDPCQVSITHHFNNPLDIAFPIVEVLDEKFISSDGDKHVCRVELIDEMLQRVGYRPMFGC